MNNLFKGDHDYFISLETRKRFYAMGWEIYSADFRSNRDAEKRGRYWLFNGGGDLKLFNLEDHFTDVNNPTEDELTLFKMEYGEVPKDKDSEHYKHEFDL